MPLINANCHDCKIRISSQIIAKHFQYLILLEKISRISPSGGTGGSPLPPPINRNIGLPCPLTPLICPQKVYFLIFMQVLGILLKLLPPPPQVDPIWVIVISHIDWCIPLTFKVFTEMPEAIFQKTMHIMHTNKTLQK